MAIIFNIGESLKLSAFNILQEPIKMLMENEKEAFEKESFINKFYVMRTTDKYQEEYRSSTAMDGFKPTEDLEIAGLSDFQESYGKVFKTQIWTNSFVVSKQTMEDNQDMTITTNAMGFIKSYGRTREQYGAAMIGGALAGSVTFGGKKFDCKGMDTTDGEVDGTKQLYFHNAHLPVNNDSYNGAALSADTSAGYWANKFYTETTFSPGAPKAEEFILDVIGQVESTMKNYRDDKGNILCVMPDTIVIPTHYGLRNALLTGLKSEYGSTMGDNGVNLQYGKWKIVESPYLNAVSGFGDTDYSFILMDSKYNKEALGAVWFDRVPLTVRSYIDDGTEANVWAGRSRFGVGFNNWRAMAYVTLNSNNSTNAFQIHPNIEQKIKVTVEEEASAEA